MKPKELFTYEEISDALFLDKANWGLVYIKNRVPVKTRLHQGYHHFRFKRRMLLVHRVVWLLYYGVWPKEQIDHIDGARDNNDPSNLRDVTNEENGRNRCLGNNNTSGHIGVRWHKKANRWYAQIHCKNKYIHLGSFTEKNDAINARLKAQRELGFHENHGKVQPSSIPSHQS